MKTADANFRFPLLGFTPNGEIWGFEDMKTLTSCGPRTLRNNMQSGMELIDADGQRWIVRSIRRLGRGRPLMAWLVSALLSTRQSRIEHDLEVLAPISLAEVKSRVCASVKTFSLYHCADDEWDEVLEPLLANVRSAKDFASVHGPLGLDNFMAY
jgi:hypothetical protein